MNTKKRDLLFLCSLLALVVWSASLFQGCASSEKGTTAEFPTTIKTINPLNLGTLVVDLAPATQQYYLVTRLVEDGKPGKTLGIIELNRAGSKETYKLLLQNRLMKPKQTLHMAVYKVPRSERWTVDKWDSSAPIQVDGNGKKQETTIEVTFESSVSDPNSPFFTYSCGEDVNGQKYVDNKTKLHVDCRCSKNMLRKETFPWCHGDALKKNGFVRGDGPQFAPTKGHQTSGDVFPDRNEIVFGIDRGGASIPGGGLRRRFLIAALNYKTNTRRYVSGEAIDPAQGEHIVGKGPMGQEVSVLRRGPDGKAYLYSHGDGGWIMRVDLDTGDREVIWKHAQEGYGQCPNGVKPEGDPDWKLQDSKPAPYQNGIEGRGFTIGPDGSFYLPTRANGTPRPGYAIIRISKDGKSCKVVSTSGAEKRNQYFGGIGKGFDIKGPIGSMTWHEGKLLAITLGGDLLEVNPTTGDRRRIAGSTINGSSSAPIAYRIFVDPVTKLLMLTGIMPPLNPGLVGVDLKSGKVWTFLCLKADKDNPYTKFCMQGPQSTLLIAYWPGYRLPDGTYIGGFALRGFTRYEIGTGNSYIFSY